MNSLLPCPPIPPHLLQPPCPSKQCTRLGQQVLWTLPFCWLSPGRLSVPARIRSRAVPSRMHSGLDGLVSCWQLLQPPRGAQSLLGHTELRSHTAAPGLPPTAPEVLWHWLATHTALVSPAATTPGPPTPQPRLLSAYHWHAARPTGDRTMQHWNEHNLSFNWG